MYHEPSRRRPGLALLSGEFIFRYLFSLFLVLNGLIKSHDVADN
jgi:hypothetical protein